MFSLPESSDIVVLQGEYSIFLVITSILIACAAAYTALSMNQRMQHSSFFHRSFWLLLASFAMGLGIWSMHFIGMSAFMLPIAMHYDVHLTIISIIPAVLASYIAFYFAQRPNTTQWPFIHAGIVMGLGISAMHYIGMAAMKMDASYIYRPWLFAGSIIIAIVASYAALYTFSALQKFMGNYMVKIVTAVLMGSAITSMHYTGMFAIVFYAEGSQIAQIDHMHKMDQSLLIIVVTIGISLLLLISGLTSILDRYVDDRLHHFDSLTLFPNQRQFEKELYNSKSAGTLSIIHIHNLERWISSFGYAFGDKTIKSVANIVQRSRPAHAKIYRIDSNRFAVYQYGRFGHINMSESMEEISFILKKSFLVDNHPVLIEAVCAITHSNEKADIKDLFSNCMAVLNHSSSKSEHGVIEYDPCIHTYTFERQIIEDINRAIKENELFLTYQPKVHSRTFEITGIEALIRWEHPVYGMISPSVFIPILEKNGDIYNLTDWVIETVCKQIALWQQSGVPFHQVSINIPGAYVTSPKLLDVIHTNLSTYQINSSYIELEITETSVIDNIENAITAANNFKALGLSVALDDFGTGLSSLSHLKRIPISTIKIDKSFVDGVPVSEKDSALLKAVITLCYSLDLNVVIEGVETKDQMDFILSIKETPQIQGYYFSRPLISDEIAAWIKQGHFLTQHGS